MRYDRDFGKLVRGHSLVMVNVLYVLPDSRYLINEFWWQTLDVAPKYPRVEVFLEFWRCEIEAEIKEVKIAQCCSIEPRRFRLADDLLKI